MANQMRRPEYTMDDFYYRRRFRKWMEHSVDDLREFSELKDRVRITFAIEVFIDKRRPRIIPRIDRDYSTESYDAY